MAIFTNKEFHEKILNSGVYVNISTNRNSRSRIKGHLFKTWNKWFEKYPLVGKMIDAINSNQRPSDDHIIPLKVYDSLYEVSKKYATSKDKILNSLLNVIKDNVTAEMYEAMKAYRELSNIPYCNCNKDPINTFSIIKNFWNSDVLTKGEYAQNKHVIECDKYARNILEMAINKPEIFENTSNQNHLKEVLEIGKKNSIQYKEDLSKFLAELTKKLELKH